MAMAKINDHSKPMGNPITRSFWKPIYFSPELFPIEVFCEKVFLKYAANLQENTHAEA